MDKVKSTWNGQSAKWRQAILSDREKQDVVQWFDDGYCAGNVERAQILPNIFGHESFRSMRKKGRRLLFQPLGMLEATVLRTLWHFRNEQEPALTGEFAVELLDDLVLRDKVEVHPETVEKMWRCYSCIGLCEDRADFDYMWQWLQPRHGNREHLHEEEPIEQPALWDKTRITELKKEWKARVAYCCLVCEGHFTERGAAAVECEQQDQCRGSRWYHMECVDYSAGEEHFVCEKCHVAMN